MKGPLRPVLTLPDPLAGLDWFADLPGMTVDLTTAEAICGDLRIAIVHPDAPPSGFRSVPFDHLALRVGDVDRTLDHLLVRGARLHAAFTPDGPREIDVFWGAGVRFAFVVGPGGVPLELCAPQGKGASGAGVTGLDHIGLRTSELERTCAELGAIGARELARYYLTEIESPVTVRFLREGNLVWEVFDEALPVQPLGRDASSAWAGVAL